MAESLLPQNMRDIDVWGPKLNDFLRVSLDEYTGLLRTALGPTFDDLTITTPVDIYALSHDSFADYVANEHIDWTADQGATNIHAGNLTDNPTFTNILLNTAYFFDPFAPAYKTSFQIGGDPITADRGVLIDIGNANRAIILTGNPTLAGQDYTTTGSPTFANLTVTSLITSGDIGIGVAPAVRLHIQTVDCEETSITTSSTNTAIRIHDSVATGIGPRWGISWMGYDDKLLAAIEPDVVSGWDTHLNFYVRKAGSLYNSLHLDEDGSVDVTSSLTVDTIGEHTGAAGVTIDSVVLKDGGITLPTTSKINFRDSDIFIGSAFNGKLDIGADISVGFFYDNTDVGNAVDGQSLYINRRAAEGDDYLQFYISSDRYAIINANQTLKIQRQGSTLLLLAANALTVNGTVGAGAITGTSFIIGGNTLDTNEWAFLDGQDQSVKKIAKPTFGSTVSTNFLMGTGVANTYEGAYNIMLGYQAGYNNANTAGVEGATNVYIGYQSGYGATTSIDNTGNGNIGIGYRTLYKNTSGKYNFALGDSTLNANTSGIGNIAIGYSALSTVTTTSGSAAVGRSALFVSTGKENTAIGTYAGLSNSSGERNIFIGNMAGRRNTTLSNRLVLNSQSFADLATEITNSIIYGIMAAAPADQTLRINAVLNVTENIQVDATQVVGNRVIDARCDDALNSGDATTDGVIDALRDAMIAHGLIAAA